MLIPSSDNYFIYQIWWLDNNNFISSKKGYGVQCAYCVILMSTWVDKLRFMSVYSTLFDFSQCLKSVESPIKKKNPKYR